jgi:hypothetical protein
VNLALAAVGIALVAIGLIHLTHTARVFQLYQRLNGRRRFLQFWAGWSPDWTRLVGWGAIILGLVTVVGAFAQ